MNDDIPRRYIEAGWRRVEIGEVINEDDQYLSTSGHFERTPVHGVEAAMPDVVFITRRPAKPKEDRGPGI